MLASLQHRQPRLLGPQQRAQRTRGLQVCSAPWRSQPTQAISTSLEGYELVVVGSGNGACAFISKYLQATQGQEHRRVLVLEEGKDFLQTSFITHQANWTKSYGEKSIYKLHAATTGPNAGSRPIISGRAVTQGGGGSINYTMIHESSTWLAEQLGAEGKYDADYWDKLKQELGVLFQRCDPGPKRSPVAQALWQALINPNKGGSFFKDVPGCKETGWIPQYIDGAAGDDALGRVYTFNTQFNDFGQRTNSGTSLVVGGSAWRDNSRIDLWTDARVEALHFEPGNKTSSNPPRAPCTGLTVRRLGTRDTVERITFDAQTTTVVLAAGSSTPRLLLPHRELLKNPAIGARVNDHILLPAGFYGLRQNADGQPQVSPKDQYLPLFPEQELTIKMPATDGPAGAGSSNEASVTVTVWYDFFAGPVSDLSYFLAHLFVSLWMPNWLKTACLNSPTLFMTLKTFTALVIEAGQFFVNLKYGILTGGKEVPPVNVITGTNKFNIYYEGHYEPQTESSGDSSTRVVLKCFVDNLDGSCSSPDVTTTPDGRVAVATMAPLMRKLDVVGVRPWGMVQWLLKSLVGLPYDPDSEDDIKQYVRKYAESHLLTEQHLSGGCVLGHAAEDGSSGPDTVGQVKGSSNVIVADLSAVPLPRLSPQMTAYLVGYHIANQRYGQQLAGRAVKRREAGVSAASAAATQTST